MLDLKEAITRYFLLGAQVMGSHLLQLIKMLVSCCGNAHLTGCETLETKFRSSIILQGVNVGCILWFIFLM